MEFEKMSISAKTIAALGGMGYIRATQVQDKAIPLILEGKDVIVQSQTGTGKTAAFGVGFIEIISKDRSKKCLVLAPTRELAIQITKELNMIGQRHQMRIFAVYGGARMGGQKTQLRKGFDIVVATPGRLLDHVRQGNLDLSVVDCVILDEADRMLDIGFRKDIECIMGMVSKSRQVLLSSATIDAQIRKMAKAYMREPQMVEAGPVGKVAKIEEESIKLTRAQKIDKLNEVLGEQISRAIVFVASKRGVEFVCRRLNSLGTDARYIHGGKTQGQRERVMREFKEGRFRILVATDVAARGLHVDDVSHVVNYDQADTQDTHTHRIGRTGRMGKEGKAITFIETDPLPKKGKRGRRGGPGGYGSLGQRNHWRRNPRSRSRNSQHGAGRGQRQGGHFGPRRG